MQVVIVVMTVILMLMRTQVTTVLKKTIVIKLTSFGGSPENKNLKPIYTTDDYTEYKHYINDILENLKVNGNILSQFKETNDLEQSYLSKIKSLKENVKKLKTENKRFVEEAANYLKIIEDLPKGHSSRQNNEHYYQLQTGDLQWEHQQYNKNIRKIKKQLNKQSKQIHNHHQQTKVMPGNTIYADMVKNFTILGDSIVKWGKTQALQNVG